MVDDAEFLWVCQIVALLEAAGEEAYIAGGYVRDILLGLLPHDIDLATSSLPDKTLKVLQGAGITASLVQAAQAYPVIIASCEDLQIEIATFRRDVYESVTEMGRRPDRMEPADLFADATRRDITVNALYLNPLTFQIFDPTEQGLADVEQKIVRFVGEPRRRILEDRLRILRVVRLKNQLGFVYDGVAKEALRELSKEVDKLHPERVREELNRMITGPWRVGCFQDLQELGILQCILPEVAVETEVFQSPSFHSEGDVFTHTLLALSHLPDQVNNQLGWAALLHDIGKKECLSQDERGEIHFHGHDQVGARMTRDITRRLRFSKAESQGIEWLVAQHMRIRELPKMRPSNQISLRMQPYFDDLLTLLQADNAASLRPGGQDDQSSYMAVRRITDELYQHFEHRRTIKEAFGITGIDLLKCLDILSTSKEVHRLSPLILYLNQKYQDGEITTREDIFLAAKTWWQNS